MTSSTTRLLIQASISPGHVKCFTNDEERAAFYRRASKELGIEPAWGERMEFLQEQKYEDAKNWLQLQSMMIDECLRKQNGTILSYLGTVVTVRDLVAMADAFDGPGSAVNFWGTDSGTLIGEYLLQSTFVIFSRISTSNLPTPVI